MSKLVYAACDFLAQHSSVTDLVGSDDLGPWIFANRPDATIENTGEVMIVITSTNGWGANDHNTARFPSLIVDIWADPTRHPDMSVKRKDADLKIEAVYLAVDKIMHQVNNSLPGGGSIIWGTAEEVANKTGIRIISSSRQNEPDIKDALNTEGTQIGTIRYDVSI